MLWVHYLALMGCALGFLIAGNRAALILVAYNFIALGAYWTWGDGMPVWLFMPGDVLAAWAILALCPLNIRNVLIVAGFAGCVMAYGSPQAFEITRAISIAQFMLCWPWFASEWSGWFKQKAKQWMLRDRGVVVTRVRQ
tara:strand:- start:10924 stop:11340 length:417 start_codon:yes stop_codon:yes gene_type:complete